MCCTIYKRSCRAVRYPVTSDSSFRTAATSSKKMFIKTLAFLPVVFCLVTAAGLNSKPEVGPSLLRQDSFGNGKHYDTRKFTRSSVDSKKSAAISSSPQGKSSENKPGYSQLSENDSLDVASWSSEVVSSAPAYGSIGTAGQVSSGRSFAGNQGGLGGFGPSSFGSTGFGKNGGGAGSYGGQGGSFGGQSGSYGGSQSGYNGASQGAGSYGGSQGGSYGGSQSGYSGASQGGYGNNVEPAMPYRFQYNVNEYGNNFGHSQASDGNQVTGRYYVQLPDGRLQTVDFKADPLSGYTADVQYEGQAQYASNSGSGAGGYSSGAGGYSSGAGSNSGGYGGVGGGSLGQLPLAFQGDFGGTSGGYSGPGSFGSKPY